MWFWVEMFNTWTLAVFSVCGCAGCLPVLRYVFANASENILQCMCIYEQTFVCVCERERARACFSPELMHSFTLKLYRLQQVWLCYIWNIPGNNHSSNSSVNVIFTPQPLRGTDLFCVYTALSGLGNKCGFKIGPNVHVYLTFKVKLERKAKDDHMDRLY